MSCCGKAKSVIGKAKNIAVGYSRLATGKRYEWTDDRIRVCQQCEKNTWMSRSEYAGWLFSHGIKVLTNLDDLSVLPMLPKYELGEGRRVLYCRICKCDVPAKARVEDEQCLMGKWKNHH